MRETAPRRRSSRRGRGADAKRRSVVALAGVAAMSRRDRRKECATGKTCAAEKRICGRASMGTMALPRVDIARSIRARVTHRQGHGDDGAGWVAAPPRSIGNGTAS